ncbi:unnamed protein product [Cylindrotheca closterium]|uniref:Uncharacterized protein n=1 Tax=Cylindrotheca closterium TaxID=2856 RepID=A0AAD2CNS1_9STRA|nr:unnamed protein product [Cylindrotheca closterium]
MQQKALIRNEVISNQRHVTLWKKVPPTSPSISQDTLRKSSCLYSRPQDNLVSGIAEIGIGFALGVLWSEFFIAFTGCGPTNFSDTLERICYQGVIVLAGVALFNRIVTGGKDLEKSAEDVFGPLESFTLIQVQIAEYSSALAVVGAFVALGFQYSRGADIDGLSGIDVAMCRAIRDL